MKLILKILPKFLRRALADLVIQELQGITEANVDAWRLAAIAAINRVLGP